MEKNSNFSVLLKPLILLAILFYSPLRAESPSRAVFDIDGVMAYGIAEPVLEQFPAETFPSAQGQAGQVFYFLTPGTAETLFAVREVLGMELTFFSADREERNLSLLRNVPILPGVSALQYANNRLFSQDQLVNIREFGRTYHPENSIFAGIRKKTLGLVGDGDLGNTVLIDDYFQYTRRGEEKNLLKVDGAPSFLSLVEEIRKGASKEEIADRETRKLVRVVGLLALAQERAKQDGVSLTEALQVIQWNGDAYRVGETHSEEVYEKGNQVFSSPAFVAAAQTKGLKFNPGACALFHKLLDHHLEK